MHILGCAPADFTPFVVVPFKAPLGQFAVLILWHIEMLNLKRMFATVKLFGWVVQTQIWFRVLSKMRWKYYDPKLVQKFYSNKILHIDVP